MNRSTSRTDRSPQPADVNEKFAAVAAAEAESIGNAFARRLSRQTRLAALVGILSVALMTLGLLERAARREAVENARLVSAALRRGQGTYLAEEVRRLRDRWAGLAGAAIRGDSGAIGEIEPDWPEYRAIASASADHLLKPLRHAVQLDGNRIRLWSVALPLDSAVAGGERLVVFLANASNAHAWLLTLAITVGVLGGLSFLEHTTLHRWFEKNVECPLKALVSFTKRETPEPRLSSRRDARGSGVPAGREVDASSEDPSNMIRGSSAEFGAVVRYILATQARTQMVERQAQRQFREQLMGMDRQLRRAEDRATTDTLTGLRNRAYLERELEAIFQRQKERAEDLAVVMIDVDNFKGHNDTRGHKAGDEVLRFLGDLLRGSIRPTDHAIRYGGDEFLLLLPGASLQQAHVVVERIVKLFGQYAATLAKGPGVSLSAGIVALNGHRGDDGHALITKADTALYGAKRKGKNMVVSDLVA